MSLFQSIGKWFIKLLGMEKVPNLQRQYQKDH